MIRLFVTAGLLWHLAHDPWWGRDKAQHLALSFIVTSAVDLGLRQQQRPERVRRTWSIGVSLSLGLLKELHDAYGGTGFSLRDLTADALGTLLAWATP